MHDTLLGFFTLDLERVRAAVAAIHEPGVSHGAVVKTDTIARYRDRLRFERGGLFAEHIFGPARDYVCACGELAGREHEAETCTRCGVVCGPSSLRGRRWGHVDVAGVVHPVVFGAARGELGAAGFDLARLAIGEAVLRDGAVISADPASDDPAGPHAIAELLRAVDPSHPLLPLCAVTRIPVPPPELRPLVRDLAPSMIDPWIGPVNTTWLELIARASRELRLIELDAPAAILDSESLGTQRAFLDVFAASQPAKLLVPPLVATPAIDEADVLAIAYVRPGVLVVQRAAAVHVVTEDGRTLHTAAPAGCKLAGVAGDRYAVFDGFLRGLDPMFSEDVSAWGPFVTVVDRMHVTAPHIPRSVLDCETGTYLVEPPNLPLPRIANDQPEDLFYEDPTGRRTRMFVGSDRPGVIASTRDLRFAWVGEVGSGTQVIDVATGIPHVLPGEPEHDACTGTVTFSDGGADEAWGSAAAYRDRDRTWHFLWPQGLCADHIGTPALCILPPPVAGAFDADVARLAVIADDRVAVVDLATRVVVHSFPLPG